jgi:hypothetical protein
MIWPGKLADRLVICYFRTGFPADDEAVIILQPKAWQKTVIVRHLRYKTFKVKYFDFKISMK